MENCRETFQISKRSSLQIKWNTEIIPVKVISMWKRSITSAYCVPKSPLNSEHTQRCGCIYYELSHSWHTLLWNTQRNWDTRLNTHTHAVSTHCRREGESVDGIGVFIMQKMTDKHLWQLISLVQWIAFIFSCVLFLIYLDKSVNNCITSLSMTVSWEITYRAAQNASGHCHE